MKNILPQYYRIIPAVKAREERSDLFAEVGSHFRRRGQTYLLVLLAAEVVLFIGLAVLGAYLTSVYLKIKEERRVELTAFSTWEQLIKKHPTYPQAYYGAALHALRLGDSIRATEYLQKALSIDSGFEAAKKLKSEIK